MITGDTTDRHSNKTPNNIQNDFQSLYKQPKNT